MLLDNFDAAHARLWQISTGVNTELMLNQVLLHLNLISHKVLIKWLSKVNSPTKLSSFCFEW